MLNPVRAAEVTPQIDESLVAHADRLSGAFRQAATLAQPSVVTIIAERRHRPANQISGEPPTAPHRFGGLFGNDSREFSDPTDKSETDMQRGFASGIIISSDGYILTSGHVVSEIERIRVRLLDNTTHPAKTVGIDPMTDIAVVKIEHTKLRPADFADSDKVRVGDLVLAIGGPFGLENSVTIGVISAKDRSVSGVTDYESFLQTDAAVNPGSSGGPLINMRGQVVGINTAIATHSGTSAGVAFAVPGNMTKSIMGPLIKSGHFNRGFLGAALQDLTLELAESFHFTGGHGVLVGDVSKGGPAEKSGIQLGDIILSFHDKNVGNAAQLRNLVALAAPQSVIDLELFRGGKRQKIQVQLGVLDEKLNEAPANYATSAELGMSIQSLTPEIARQFGCEDRLKGIAIISVEPGSPAHLAGLRIKDVVVSVDAEKVTDTKSFQDGLSKLDLNHGVRLQVKTGGISHFVFLRMGQK